MATIPRYLTYKGIPVWRHALVIQWAAQIISGVLVVALVVWFFSNIAKAIEEREIPSGFGFLDRAYQTAIGQHFLPYESSDTFLYAFVVAATNTIIVSIVGVILATVLGVAMGVARMSSSWIVSKAALAYIEFFRNVPLLVQLFFWFYIVLALPPVQEGYVIGQQLYINNAGISIPFLSSTGRLVGTAAWVGLVVAAVITVVAVYRWLAHRETRTGATPHPLAMGFVTVIAIGAAGWLIIGAAIGEAPLAISSPEPQGRFGRIEGGFTASGGCWRCWLAW